MLSTRVIQDRAHRKVEIEDGYKVDLSSMQPSLRYLRFKRILDLGFTLAAAPFLVPICLVVCVLVKLDSPGPVLFVQERVGKGNRVFQMYKFRSMRMANAGKIRPLFADQESHRITRLGSLLRKFRIDEIPQFINVLKGEMSVIGPRPEQQEFARKFEGEIPLFSHRTIVPPGITGWAQVNNGYASTTEATRLKLEYDLYYIKNLSFRLDLLVILRTCRTIVTGFGAI